MAFRGHLRPHALELLSEEGHAQLEIALVLLESAHRRAQASHLGAQRFDLIAGGAHETRIYDLGVRAERDGCRSAMLDDFREADAIRWNSLLSESVFPPTCAPQTLQA